MKWIFLALLLIFATAYVYLGLKEWEPRKALVNVRGSAAIAHDLPYTLNLQQQEKLLAAYNSGKKVSTPPQMSYEGEIERFLIYTFEREEPIELIPLSEVSLSHFLVESSLGDNIRERGV